LPHQRRVAASDQKIYDALAANGRLALQGIYFDTGSDTLRPESSGTLKEIGQMLQDHPELRLKPRRRVVRAIAAWNRSSCSIAPQQPGNGSSGILAVARSLQGSHAVVIRSAASGQGRSFVGTETES